VVKTLGEAVFQRARPDADGGEQEMATKAPLANIQPSQPVVVRYRCAAAIFSFL
jgi:hypothetical protein